MGWFAKKYLFVARWRGASVGSFAGILFHKGLMVIMGINISVKGNISKYRPLILVSNKKLLGAKILNSFRSSF